MKIIITLLFLFLACIFVPQSFATDIQMNNGNSSTQVYVETSGGTTETNISVESNGVKKEIHSTTPGTIDVKIDGDEVISITHAPDQDNSTSSALLKKKHPTLKDYTVKVQKHFLETFFLNFKNFFYKLF